MTHRHFHISRAARNKYQLDAALFSLRGTIVFANFYSARLLAQKINQARDILQHPDQAVQAGELNALGLLHEILHFILEQYRQQRGDAMTRAVNAVYDQVGADAVETTLQRFVDEFPPLPVYRGEVTIEQYLNGVTEGISNREITLEEMILLWLENQNPAASAFKELFDDTVLMRQTAYPVIIQTLQAFFAEQEPYGTDGQKLFDVLRAPFISAPGSLSDQLNFMLNRWRGVLGHIDLGRYFYRAVGGMQLIREEQQFLFRRATGNGAGGGGGFTATTPPVPVFGRIDEAGHPVWFEPEPEQFSPDLDWMPRLVLLAKSTYVWLDQLSLKYGRAITRLDQIPDEELDDLAQRGFTGLWFIGVWERSPASARIKQLLGNQDAIASAYSLYEYQIASELGGAEALQQLKARAAQRGIRLASDMVPNHMGIDSRWVIEHPEWFIQAAEPPYPAYSFNGPDLSSDGRVTIQIEDHYWDRSDAAVVFKRYDQRDGDTRYIYHGNDGTTFPWNDTAQLNYLMAEVREQVIQTILHVARQFPVIRFDAAMTLAKKHFERLWFPLPTETNTIPSRSEYAMTRAEFDRAMPNEFWREVVDRIAAEAPDTLLLAEAFWLMEGYFVRTLGMHRVYNSAFMHMLRDEKNQEFRLTIKNTIEFDPEILRRYVNFMNNPDERTAVDQFGKGDKYFGVCTIMVTLPGLPMFGHGQIEGFTERYGMEFRRALLDETADQGLIDHHAREIFPLLHKRSLFAGVENFLLYDLTNADGSVDENVIAFSNRYGQETALVAYNNAYSNVRGTLRMAAAYRDKARDELVHKTLTDGLALVNGDEYFVIFRDHSAQLEYLRRNRTLIRDGFTIELGAYKYQVLLGFRQVQDTPDHLYALLHDRLHGRGVPSVEAALRELHLEPLHDAFRQLFDLELLRGVGQTSNVKREPTSVIRHPSSVNAELSDKANAFARVVNEWNETTVDENAFGESLLRNLADISRLQNLPTLFKRPSKSLRAALDDLQIRLADPAVDDALIAWAVMDAVGTFAPAGVSASGVAATWMDEWQLGRLMSETFTAVGIEPARATQLATLVQIALLHPASSLLESPAIRSLVSDPQVARFLNINRFNDINWFNQEAFEALINWLQVIDAIVALRRATTDKELRSALTKQYETEQKWRAAQSRSEFQVEKLLDALSGARTRPAISADSPQLTAGRERAAGNALARKTAKDPESGISRADASGIQPMPQRSDAPSPSDVPPPSNAPHQLKRARKNRARKPQSPKLPD